MRVELFNDNFQNYKRYGINSKAQLVIADKNKLVYTANNYSYTLDSMV